MMQVGAEDLEQVLDRREARWGPPTGVEYVRVTGVRGLKEAGVLKGVRAMVARVYGGEGWYVHDAGGTGRVECLYESKRKGGRHEVKFVVARMVDGEGWEAGRAEVAREAGVREGAGTGQMAGGVGDPEPGANHIRQEDTSRWPDGPLNNTPWGVIQRTGEGTRNAGARATGAATTTGRVADGGKEAGAATVAAGREECFDGFMEFTWKAGGGLGPNHATRGDGVGCTKEVAGGLVHEVLREVERPARAVYRVHPPHCPRILCRYHRGEVTFEEADGAGETLVRWQIDMVWIPVLGLLMVPVIHFVMNSLLRNLKAHVEGGPGEAPKGK